MALPGSIYLYQGEELGLPEVWDLPPRCSTTRCGATRAHTQKGRDGCRVPLPWTVDGDVVRLRRRRHLAAPAVRFRRAVGRSPGGRRRLDPRDVPRRAAHRARWFTADEDLTWIELGDDVLAFRRGSGVVCIVNYGTEPVALPDGEVLVASLPGDRGDAAARRCGLAPTDLTRVVDPRRRPGRRDTESTRSVARCDDGHVTVWLRQRASPVIAGREATNMRIPLRSGPALDAGGLSGLVAVVVGQCSPQPPHGRHGYRRAHHDRGRRDDLTGDVSAHARRPRRPPRIVLDVRDRATDRTAPPTAPSPRSPPVTAPPTAPAATTAAAPTSPGPATGTTTSAHGRRRAAASAPEPAPRTAPTTTSARTATATTGAGAAVRRPVVGRRRRSRTSSGSPPACRRSPTAASSPTPPARTRSTRPRCRP